MSERILSEDELAVLVVRRFATLFPASPPPTEEAALNRVGAFLDMRWSAEDDLDDLDTAVREVCVESGGLDNG